MADNTTLPGTGDVIASDDISGVKYQIIKLGWGPLDSINLVDITTGKPVPFQLRSPTGVAATILPASTAPVASDPAVVVSLSPNSSGLTTLGQALMAASAPVTIASDQSAVPISGKARTTNPTAVTDGQATAPMFDKLGKQVVLIGAPRDLQTRSGVVTISTTTETTLMAAGGAGVFLDMMSIKLVNTSATAVRVDIRDVTAGTVQDTFYLPAGDTRGAVYHVPFRQTTANSAWTATLSGAVTDVRIVAQFIQNI